MMVNEVRCSTSSKFIKSLLSRSMRGCYKVTTRFPHSSTNSLHPPCFRLLQLQHPPSSVVPRYYLSAFYTMKPQATAAAAVCLVVLLMASEMVVTSEAAGCDIVQLVPCMAASKNARVTPSKQCCTNIARMGKGLPGAKCLCSLLSHPLAKSNGVVPWIALAIPQKCRIAVPQGFVCQGIRVPGS